MLITINTRKLQTAGLATAIFAAGTGIGWQIAGLIFAVNAPTPVAAAIRFEEAQPVSQIPSIRVPSTAPADARAALAEEARKLADAMAWAERYRRSQEETVKVAAAGAHGWAEVIANANRFGPGRYDVQKVVQAQIAREKRQHAAQQVQLASTAAKPVGTLASQATAERIVHAVKSNAEKAARKRQGGARHATRRHHERTLHRPIDFLCPLTWLQATADHFRFDRRTRRHRIG